mmetsp:Transcript_18554/g.27945  ORF Transcript_18554/g.27945 Transcript_18554/m.27945 type:complete len:216 (+) Transcript_18554:1039-1686(+)|eukprot:CAMPEP_0197292274 /NCGR_PEP_ID=MMETSP0890-20130614/22205_1 /TAXON_ID=44058 ORGANISM="Aureoumbra lagunensis, Strain CCMP1510" /NCGR_SAMPLE_ID=MMETSP0890 /ASSEMBLY_ACC=CAM_ASM_000533 /LENGTH=215 /DNA_ID=CAMNT_0042766043 /DNA_START=18 /DNA_END=665 /DNA_ORIENTATION=-
MGIESREVSLSGFGYLFSEVVQYHVRHIETVSELERKLEDVGFALGRRFLEFVAIKDSNWKRNASEINIVQYISSSCWKALYGKNADSLERSTERDREYMIYDTKPLTNHYISVPKELGSLDCASFMAGLATGMLDAAGFVADVKAHTIEVTTTVFLVRFFDSYDELYHDTPQENDGQSYFLASEATISDLPTTTPDNEDKDEHQERQEEVVASS